MLQTGTVMILEHLGEPVTTVQGSAGFHRFVELENFKIPSHKPTMSCMTRLDIGVNIDSSRILIFGQ